MAFELRFEGQREVSQVRGMGVSPRVHVCVCVLAHVSGIPSRGNTQHPGPEGRERGTLVYLKEGLCVWGWGVSPAKVGGKQEAGRPSPALTQNTGEPLQASGRCTMLTFLKDGLVPRGDHPSLCLECCPQPLDPRVGRAHSEAAGLSPALASPAHRPSPTAEATWLLLIPTSAAPLALGLAL